MNVGTDAGFYNFTFTTDAVPSTAEIDGPTAGYGKNVVVGWHQKGVDWARKDI